jgi:ubiquitin-conjugating enzyme E2 J2
MAPAMATARLRKELVSLQKDPPPGVIAEPDESNILKWHYAIKGPTDTGFEGGVYVGKLIFPNEYPMKPPGIMMLTPSGRFKCNTRLCLSMSDYHPESWNPMWSVATIIQGVQSFMASDELTTGGIKSPVTEHKRLAAESSEYNKKMFPNLFGGDINAAFNGVDATSSEILKPAVGAPTEQSTSTTMDSSLDSSKAGPRRAKRDKQPPLASRDETVVDESLLEPLVLHDEAQQELSPEEHEKRRERNAKRRAKQKQKREGAASVQMNIID